jgi:ATP-dependent Lon protease
MNLSLITALTLLKLLTLFKIKYQVFPHVLRDIIINEERILKALNKLNNNHDIIFISTSVLII